MEPKDVTKLRIVWGLTQRALAAALRVHPMTVSRWERGTVTPTFQHHWDMRRLVEHANKCGWTGGNGGLPRMPLEQIQALILFGYQPLPPATQPPARTD